MPHTLLLHGFTGSAESWKGAVMDGLATEGLEPRAIDLPGHGARAGEVDPQAFTLDRVVDEARGAGGPDPFDLVGYSLGGRMALATAVRHPGHIHRLVLESASPGLATPEERAARVDGDGVRAHFLESRGIEAFVDAWEALPLFATQRRLPDDVRAAVRLRRLANDPASLAASLRGLGTGAQPSFWGDLEALHVPTLVLVGEEDRTFVDIGREMAGALPDARLVVVRGAGHAVHLERPDEWLDAVVGFLKED